MIFWIYSNADDTALLTQDRWKRQKEQKELLRGCFSSRSLSLIYVLQIVTYFHPYVNTGQKKSVANIAKFC